MQSIGNERANLYWEGDKSKGGFSKPSSSASAPQRKVFIKDKYIKKLWADAAIGNPVELYTKAVQMGHNAAEYIKNNTGHSTAVTKNTPQSQAAGPVKKPEFGKLATKGDPQQHVSADNRKPSFDLLEFDKPTTGTPKDKKSCGSQSQAKMVRQPSTDLFNFDGTPPKGSHAYSHSQPTKGSSHSELNLLGSPMTQNQVSQTPPPFFNFSQPQQTQLPYNGSNLASQQNPQTGAQGDKYAALNMASMFNQPRHQMAANAMGGFHNPHHHNFHYHTNHGHHWG